jgi:diadenylate cyclase
MDAISFQNIGATVIGAFNSFPQFWALVETKDIFDILIVGLIIYLVFIFIKQTKSFFIFNSFLALLVLVYISKNFDLTLTRQLFQPLLTFFIVIFVVVFQREIRRFFDWFSLGSKNLALFRKITISSEVSSSIVKAVHQMAEDHTGAIIVLPGEYPLDDLVEGGFPLDGKVSVTLLLSIFDTGSPGHDGAVLIKDNLIKTFGLHLPLAEHYKDYAGHGTRHRAAAGITERSDALAIVVSEEKGTVSLAEGGVLTLVRDSEDLEEKIKLFLKENILEANRGFWHYVFVNNLLMKISSLVLAILLWFFFVFQTGVITREYTVPVQLRFLPREYTLDNITPQEITVRISGKNADLVNFDENNLRASVDASEFVPGRKQVSLTPGNISLPSYVNLVKIDPERISVTVLGVIIESESQPEASTTE